MLNLYGLYKNPKELKAYDKTLRYEGPLANPDGGIFEVQVWYKNGKRHREGDLPALISFDSDWCEWWKNGQQHRDGDQPAYIGADGTQVWYKYGQEHRDGDLPAVIYDDGSQEWYKNGRRHRDGDRPAVIWGHGVKQWWKNGERVARSLDEYHEWAKRTGSKE